MVTAQDGEKQAAAQQGSGVVGQAWWEGTEVEYWRKALVPLKCKCNVNLPIWKRTGPRLEPLGSFFSVLVNPRGGAHVTQDSLANQNLHSDLAVRKLRGFPGDQV